MKKVDDFPGSPKANGGEKRPRHGAIKDEPGAGGSSSAAGRKESSERSSSKHRRGREASALYLHQRLTNNFDWGMMLSDALKRQELENKRSKSSVFFEEARSMKGKGDAADNRVSGALKYLESATSFILGSE